MRPIRCVGLLVLRALVVDDVGDVLDIDASGRDIGGDQDVDLAGPEGAQCLLAGALSEVAVQGGAAKPRSVRSSATLAAVRLLRLKMIVQAASAGPGGCARASSVLSIACAR